jgi:hypothetical protein
MTAPKAPPYTSSGARISPDGLYRYLLWREWRGTHDPNNWSWLKDGRGQVAVDGGGFPLGEPKSLLFIMLNPSTADGVADDPTIRRCIGFARAWKFERLEVVNLFAYRAPQPSELFALNYDDDPVGEHNQEMVRRAADRAGMIICAWGAHGAYLGQDETVLGWLGERKRHALGLTKAGHPSHPLYLPAKSQPQEFRP